MLPLMIHSLFPELSEEAERARLARLSDAAQGISRVLNLALALAQSGRRVDLGGIDRQVGILCAQSLDLPPALGREMVPLLEAQIAALDRLRPLISTA